jgi:hypothetical protein
MFLFLREGSNYYRKPHHSRIQRHAKLFRQNVRIKRTAREELSIQLKRRDLTPPVIHAHHQVFRVRGLIHINLLDGDSALFQEFLRAPAIRAPARGVHLCGWIR